MLLRLSSRCGCTGFGDCLVVEVDFLRAGNEVRSVFGG